MIKELIRIFHPIGQGAFISERHNDFNIVYDCGVDWANRNSKYVNQLVKNSFNIGATIDILFISHFDYDHISKIPILQANFRIKKVVLPLLSSNERQVLSEVYKGLGVTQDVQNIIDSPDDQFSESQIIQVKPFNSNEDETEDLIVQLDKLTSRQISSGTKIRTDFWEYIPYNLEHKVRVKQFEALLNSNGIDPKELKENFVYTEQFRKKLKKIYTKVKGDINQNSMVVYSGPIDFKTGWLSYYDFKRSNNIFSRKYRIIRKRISSIYTGDSNMNDYNLQKIFKSNWRKVALLQIPHHGDIKSFDNSQITRKYFCIINFGSKNSYGHPANNLLADLVMKDQYIKFVTEDPNSIFIIKVKYNT